MSRLAPDPDATAAAARALVERQQALLARLADMGMEIAEAACRRACAAETFADAEGPTLSYTRAARAVRAVRLTLAMQQRLAKQAEELDKADHLARSGEAHRRRRLIQREVERVAEQAAAEHDIDALSSRGPRTPHRDGRRGPAGLPLRRRAGADMQGPGASLANIVVIPRLVRGTQARAAGAAAGSRTWRWRFGAPGSPSAIGG